MLEKRFLRNKALYERYLQCIRTIKKKDSFLKESFFFRRASDGNRTRDLLTTNEVRYRLCHASLSDASFDADLTNIL